MNEIKQICVSRIDRMGDLIMTSPALKIIRKCWPESKITLLVSNNNYKVLRNSKIIDNIIVINKNNSFSNILKNIKTIRKLSFDHFINFSPITLSYIICFFSGAVQKSIIIYLSRYRRTFSKILLRIFAKIYCDNIEIIDRKKLMKSNKDFHQTKIMIKFIEKISNKRFSDPDIEIPVISELESKIKNVFNKKIITIHLSKRWKNQYYSIKDLKSLLSKLSNYNNYHIILTTEIENDVNFKEITKDYQILSFNDFNDLNFIKGKILNNVIIVLDGFNYENWIAVIKNSHKVITPESGCTHVAAAFKVPVAVIYNANNLPEYIYKEYFPWKCLHNKIIFNKKNNINEKILKFLD